MKFADQLKSERSRLGLTRAQASAVNKLHSEMLP